MSDELKIKDYNTPPVSVTAVLVKDKKLLLVRRRGPFKKGYWVMPGGYIEINESPDEALLRELYEETGVSYKGKIVLIDALKDTFTPSGVGVELFYILKDFSLNELKKDTDEADVIELFDINNLPSPINPIHLHVIQKYGKYIK